MVLVVVVIELFIKPPKFVVNLCTFLILVVSCRAESSKGAGREEF